MRTSCMLLSTHLYSVFRDNYNSLSLDIFGRPNCMFVEVWSDRLSDQRIRREP